MREQTLFKKLKIATQRMVEFQEAAKKKKEGKELEKEPLPKKKPR